MNIITCDRNHEYDADDHPDGCPYCRQINHPGIRPVQPIRRMEIIDQEPDINAIMTGFDEHNKRKQGNSDPQQKLPGLPGNRQWPVPPPVMQGEDFRLQRDSHTQRRKMNRGILSFLAVAILVFMCGSILFITWMMNDDRSTNEKYYLKYEVPTGGYTKSIVMEQGKKIVLRHTQELNLAVEGVDPKDVNWSSGDPAILEVKDNKIIAKKQGNVLLTVEGKGAKISAMVDILPCGWSRIGEHMYYILPEDELLTGWLEEGKKWFYFNEEGIMQVGWKEIDGKTYFFQLDGSKAYMLTGKQEIDGKEYEFSSKGELISQLTTDEDS